jgi:sialic acid synthase SpsE/quercetin dioxygenase-like cupin family protein
MISIPSSPSSPLFVFEMANNHEGSLEHGKRIIREMQKIADKYRITAAVKLQYRDLDSILHPSLIGRTDVKHAPRFLATKLKKADYLELVEAVKESGMLTICTPFDEASVASVIEHQIDVIKVASCSAKDWPLLRVIARANKPVICSTGGLSISDIDNIVSFFLHRKINLSVLHCVALYPTPRSALELGFIERFKLRYPTVSIGYSGHESPDDQETVQLAIAKGATILERHVGIASDGIRLNAYSMDPAQADAWVAAATRAIDACGSLARDGEAIRQEELGSLASLERGVYAARPVKAGEQITRTHVYFAMPLVDGQARAGDFQEDIVASQDYQADEPILDKRTLGVAVGVRGLIHEVKGMINEAGISVGSDFNIEISHHYGIERVRQSGAVILTIVNREYCKKLVVLVAGQCHPNHRHITKEETFQLLWGDLEIQLDDKIHSLRAGDLLLIPRRAWHAMSTRNGAIFEEVSTSHIRGDSYYSDEAIEGIDPMERKTVVEQW